MHRKANGQGMGIQREIRGKYDQVDFLPQALDRWGSENHPARFIREFVDALSLVGLGFRRREGQVGRELRARLAIGGTGARIHAAPSQHAELKQVSRGVEACFCRPGANWKSRKRRNGGRIICRVNYTKPMSRGKQYASGWGK